MGEIVDNENRRQDCFGKKEGRGKKRVQGFLTNGNPKRIRHRSLWEFTEQRKDQQEAEQARKLAGKGAGGKWWSKYSEQFKQLAALLGEAEEVDLSKGGEIERERGNFGNDRGERE